MQESKPKTIQMSEVWLLLILVAATAFTILLAADKLAFLSFYQIPVLVAAYFLGRRQGVMVALVGVMMVGLYAALNPQVFAADPTRSPTVAIFIWGAFLVVTAYVVGTLYEAKAQAIVELRNAYEGVVDILSELIDAVDQFADNHSVRVADLAAKTAVVMNLPNDEIENIRVAGLLHDIRKVDVSIDVLRKAAAIERAADAEPGSAIPRRALGTTGGLLRNVVPLVEAYAECYDGSGPKGLSGDEIPLGSRVLAAADSLDRLLSPPPYGSGLAPAEALMDLEKHSGSRHDPRVIDAIIVMVEAGTPTV